MYLFPSSSISIFRKPLRYVIGRWKLAPLANPFFGDEGMSSRVFKILAHYVAGAIRLVEKKKTFIK